ncbi:hypothetical protein FraEuI1c_0129 [Pseudofrankia inefficax]|uniref:Uncharacterized protein n=1 Tax=Pseudofrankia inefficax (strain DSM 45817 / CECT 9037 / DDB 130130 / EuI1c) TaxID=298654 RepID=E3J4P8_PSEI1|nr:hypothetical protein FraEuI1c_0129 [Pseudofrankia inefficax]
MPPADNEPTVRVEIPPAPLGGDERPAARKPSTGQEQTTRVKRPQVTTDRAAPGAGKPTTTATEDSAATAEANPPKAHNQDKPTTASDRRPPVAATPPRRPATSRTVPPAAGDEPAPAAEKAKAELRPTDGQQPAAPSETKPAAPADTKATTPVSERPAASADTKPAAPVDRKATAPADRKPATPGGRRPAAPAAEEPTTRIDRRPAADAGTKRPAPADPRPATPAIRTPPAPVGARPAAPGGERPPAPAATKPATPVETKPPAAEAPTAPPDAGTPAGTGESQLLPEYVTRLRPLLKPPPAAVPEPAPAGSRIQRIRDALADVLWWNSAYQPADPERAAETLHGRLLLSGASLLSFTVGVLSVAAGLTHLRIAALLVFCLIGIGSAPWALDTRMRLTTRMAMTTLVSFSVLTFVATFMLSLGRWHPALAFTLVSLICVPLHWIGFRRAVVERRDARPAVDLTPLRDGTWNDVVDRLRLREFSALYCAVAGAVLCMYAALRHRHIVDPGVYGYLTHVGPAWYLGLALIVVAIVIAPRADERVMAAVVLLLVVAVLLTPSLVYDAPRQPSATKHVDLVQQIRHAHHLDALVLVYNGWAGMFAAMAWLCDITGIREPMGLATFWPPLIGFFKVLALRYFAGKVLPTAYQAWIAVILGVLADTIGADYFSPQSVGYVIGLVAFGLALSHRRSVQRTLLLVSAGLLISVTHQLSPYIVGGALVILVVFRQIRPWWTPVTVLGPAAAWALLHWSQVKGFINLHDIGSSQNFHPPKTAGAVGLVRQPIVGETVHALMLGVGLIGLIGGLAVLRNRRTGAVWAYACCPAVGLVVVAVNPYGNEGIFRAILFALPWLSVLAARMFTSKRRLLPRIPLLAVMATMTATFLVAAFGLDDINVVRWSDLNTLRYFQTVGYSNSPANAYYVLQLGAGDLPASIPTRTNSHRPLKIEDLQDAQAANVDLPPATRMRILTSRLITYSGEPASQARIYTIWSPVSSEYGYDYGVETPAEFAELRDAFAAAPYWSIAKDLDGTVLFKFEPARYPVPTP